MAACCIERSVIGPRLQPLQRLTVIHRTQTVENVATDPEDPLAEIYDRKAGHLTEEDVDFFTKWEHLVTLEEQDIIQNKNQTWTMTAPERERSGR